eukprot:7840416-Karenia_brevis.AAC.1
MSSRSPRGCKFEGAYHFKVPPDTIPSDMLFGRLHHELRKGAISGPSSNVGQPAKTRYYKDQ